MEGRRRLTVTLRARGREQHRVGDFVQREGGDFGRRLMLIFKNVADKFIWMAVVSTIF